MELPPISLRVEQRGDAVLVHDFGSPNGTICVLLGDQVRPAPQEPADVSQLSLLYLRYDRALFVDTLIDWGWFGEGPAFVVLGGTWTTS
jgi:hypothetical protein